MVKDKKGKIIMIKYNIYKIEEKSNEDQSQIVQKPLGHISISDRQFNMIHLCVLRYLGKYGGPILSSDLESLDKLLISIDKVKNGDS